MGSATSRLSKNTPPPYEHISAGKTIKYVVSDTNVVHDAEMSMLSTQPITIDMLNKERELFKRNQNNTYRLEYDRVCNIIVKNINSLIINKKFDKFVVCNISAEYKGYCIPDRYKNTDLDIIHMKNLFDFVCKAYKDFKPECVYEDNNGIKVKLYLPK